MTFYDLNEALDRLLAGVVPAQAVETVGVLECEGRVLAEAVTVRRNLPPFSNSGMDGYAVKLGDAGKTVRIAGTIFAGGIPEGEVKPGEAIKIMTGAPTPAGCEAVVMFEQTEKVGDDRIKLPEKIAADQNTKAAGEELQAGAVLFKAGEKLGAAHGALLASQGIMAVRVFKRLKVAVVSGGDEVVEPWQTPGAYQIYNTNSAALCLSLKSAGFEPLYASLGGDDTEALAARLEAIIDSCDAVLTTGGISMGEADFTRAAFEKLGIEIFFHGLNLKPGRPTLAGRIGRKLAVALPGNPLSALANFHLLVLPALFKMQGQTAFATDFVTAENTEPFGLKGDRDTALLGRLEGGRFTVCRGGKYGSGMLLPVAESNALAVFERSVHKSEAGQNIKVVPIGFAPAPVRKDVINR